MHNFRHQRRFILAATILAGGILIAAGVLALANFNNSGPIAIIQSPQWTRDAGAGIAVPACNASLASITCSGGYPVVQIAIDSCDQHGGAELQFYSPGLPAGYYNAGSFACGSIAEWSAVRPGYVGPPQSNTTYTWDTAAPNAHGSPFSTGSFTTPNCVIPPPLSASCSVSPASASVGQNVTWSASASGGTGAYTYSWSGTEDLSGSPASFSSPGGYSWTVPSGFAEILVNVWGGGGGGGGARYCDNGTGTDGSGGGGGGGFAGGVFSVSQGSGYGLNVGTGGSGGSGAQDGSGGGSSNFSSFLSASGGAGGKWSAGGTGIGGTAGTGSGQDTASGQSGSNGIEPAGGRGGDGGRGGSGGVGGPRGSGGNSGTAPGGGGGGAAGVSNLGDCSSVPPGGSGAPGRVTISPKSVQKSYSSSGTKTGSVRVESGSQSVTQSCSNSVFINTPPNPPGRPGGGGGGFPSASGGGISVPPGSGVNSGSAVFGENPAGACLSPRQPAFAWTYSDPDGDPQSAYQLQVDNNSGFSSPEIDTGKTSGTATSYLTPPGVLSYNTAYYWRVRVWDSKDAASNWSSGETFSTQPHEAPSANYTWSPTEPNVNQKTKFTDQSTVYGGSSKQSWTWTFSDGNPSSSAQQNPDTKFQSGGDKATTLILKDSDNLSCGAQKTVTVGGLPSSPSWEEVTPE